MRQPASALVGSIFLFVIGCDAAPSSCEELQACCGGTTDPVECESVAAGEDGAACDALLSDARAAGACSSTPDSGTGGCAAAGASCDFNTCCAGLACDRTRTCRTCSATGQACSSIEDCCDYHASGGVDCVSGTCQSCGQDGASCSSNSECCSGYCDAECGTNPDDP
jgi:hypothetical protein